MRSARPRVVSISEHEQFAEYAEYQPYRPPVKQPSRIDPFWVGIVIIGVCSIFAFIYVGWFQWR